MNTERGYCLPGCSGERAAEWLLWVMTTLLIPSSPEGALVVTRVSHGDMEIPFLQTLTELLCMSLSSDSYNSTFGTYQSYRPKDVCHFDEQDELPTMDALTRDT